MTISVQRQEAFAAAPAVVLFDLDNTIYEYAPPHRFALAETGRKAERLLSVSIGQFQQAYDEARRQVKERLGPSAASHSRLLYYQRAIELLGLNSQPLLALDFEQTYWRAFLSAANLCDGLTEFLEELRIAGIKTGLVTDLTAQIQFRKLVYFGLDHTFDAIVTSEEVGRDKPDPRCFELVLAKLGDVLGPVWMIGDNPTSDIQGAKSAISATTLMMCHGQAPKSGERASEQTVDLTFDNYVELRRFLRPLLMHSAA